MRMDPWIIWRFSWVKGWALLLKVRSQFICIFWVKLRLKTLLATSFLFSLSLCNKSWESFSSSRITICCSEKLPAKTCQKRNVYKYLPIICYFLLSKSVCVWVLKEKKWTNRLMFLWPFNLYQRLLVVWVRRCICVLINRLKQ